MTRNRLVDVEASYDKFIKIVRAKELNPHKVCLGAGISNSTMTGWKYGDLEPKLSTLLKICEFLEIDLEELLIRYYEKENFYEECPDD